MKKYIHVSLSFNNSVGQKRAVHQGTGGWCVI